MVVHTQDFEVSKMHAIRRVCGSSDVDPRLGDRQQEGMIFQVIRGALADAAG